MHQRKANVWVMMAIAAIVIGTALTVANWTVDAISGMLPGVEATPQGADITLTAPICAIHPDGSLHYYYDSIGVIGTIVDC